jgi:hypothetical protein
MTDGIEKFLDSAARSLNAGTFVKLTLGNYKGADKQLQKLIVRLIETKKGARLNFQYRYETRDVAKNFASDEGLRLLSEIIGTEFYSGHLFTTENDLQLAVSKKGKSRVTAGKPTFAERPSTEHDREKQVQVDPNSFYLKALGITTDSGEVRDKQRGKWTQINKFVEIISGLFDSSELKDKKTVRIVDMGSGKGYLTFAVYDHFKNTRGIDARVTGVEVRRELVRLCNEVATSSGFDGLDFVEGTIDSFDPAGADILIALHACDTATDDALFKGISSEAAIIIAAPCCHKELRPQIRTPEVLKGVLKHGIMLERTAETITDGLRALILEREGYATKVFEFVPTEHTPKNNMIVGVRDDKPSRMAKAAEQIDSLKNFYGVEHQWLDELIA